MEPDLKTTLKERVMSYIRNRISEGAYRPGERIETIRQLEKELNVSHVVAAGAIRELAKSGILNSKVGCGTFVSESIELLPSPGKRNGENKKNLYFFFQPKEDGKVSLYHTEILSAIQTFGKKEGWNIEIRVLGPDTLEAAGNDPDAVGAIHVSTTLQLPEVAIPVVTYGMAPHETEKCCITPDNYKAGFLAARRLNEHGYRNLIYITADNAIPNHPEKRVTQAHFTERRRGVEDYCKCGGIPCGDTLIWNIRTRKNEVVNFLKKAKIPRKTALVIGNRSMAAEIYAEAEKAGWKIPEDIGMVTFIKRGGYENRFPIDTYHFEPGEIAENCIFAIRRKRNGGTMPSRILVGMNLFEEKSIL